MSKNDALRALREARYAANSARVSTPPRSAAGAAPQAKRATPAAAAKPASAPPVVSEESCGHRNMSGRTCTRERGHAAKSHRYS